MHADCVADAWTIMPQSLSSCETRSTMKAIHSPSSALVPATATLSSILSLALARPSTAASASYNGHDGRSRIILSSSSSSSHHDVKEEEVPILRSLYDAPPRDDSKDGNNNTTSLPNEKEARWATQVTSGSLPTEEGSSHLLYYEVHRRYLHHNDKEVTVPETKKKNGLTALFLHGGPGAACFPNHVRFFSPELYETVVLLDQRGCGRSTPLGETEDNTLELLVGDVERLRLHLLQGEGEVLGGDVAAGDVAAVPVVPQQLVRPWDVILGGSWGVTLALAYAHAFPRHVRAMVLRGVCLFRPQEINWLFGDPPSLSDSNKGGLRTSNLRSLLSAQTRKEPAVSSPLEESTSIVKNTASKMFPKGWTEFCKGVSNANVQSALQGTQAAATTAEQKRTSNNNPRSILHKYYHLILGSDPLLRFGAVKSWLRWEMGVYSTGFRDDDEGKTRKNQNNDDDKNNKKSLLVWNPAMASWSYEDARVWNNHSFVSIDGSTSEVEEEMAQSLRRCSSTPSSFERRTLSESAAVEPMPVQSVVVTSDKAIPTPKTNNNSNSNSTFDPTTYIPAQPMLTCYYSTNDDYCIGAYKSFLSLSPPSYLPLSSWYSSKLPPQIIPKNLPSSSTLSSTVESSTSFPLPPTIAIQGGNDAICPPDTALDLHHVWREMELRIVLKGGHSMYDSTIAGEIVKALDRFGHALAAEE